MSSYHPTLTPSPLGAQQVPFQRTADAQQRSVAAARTLGLYTPRDATSNAAQINDPFPLLTEYARNNLSQRGLNRGDTSSVTASSAGDNIALRRPILPRPIPIHPPTVREVGQHNRRQNFTSPHVTRTHALGAAMGLTAPREEGAISTASSLNDTDKAVGRVSEQHNILPSGQGSNDQSRVDDPNSSTQYENEEHEQRYAWLEEEQREKGGKK